MMHQSRLTFSTYPIVLLLTSALVAIFLAVFFQGYFNPNYVTEYRSAAHISTVLGFIKGINPFQQAHVEEYGNVYSVLWPGMVYLLADLFRLESYDQIKSLMYAINAAIVSATAVFAFYIGLRNRLNALLALSIGFTYVLINTTKISMGEFSYSAGLSCSFLALVLVSNKFNRLACCVALGLITLASLFKVYFALLGIVVAFNCAAFLPLRVLFSILLAWGFLTGCLFVILTLTFPFYFDVTYALQKMAQTWHVFRIPHNIFWFLRDFGFIFILAAPQWVQFSQRTADEQRRQKLYALGGLIASAYVVFVMLPNKGNFGTYMLHVIAPIILAYALSRREESTPQFDRRTAQIAALVMCVLVFINPTFWTNPLHRWKEYGVLSNSDLSANRDVFMEVDKVIQSNAGRDLYVDPALAPLAIKRHLAYVDNGNREGIVEYMNVRINGFKLSPLTNWLLAPKPAGPEHVTVEDVLERADVVLCTARCPKKGTHRLVRDLGVWTQAWGGSFVVRMFQKGTDDSRRGARAW